MMTLSKLAFSVALLAPAASLAFATEHNHGSAHGGHEPTTATSAQKGDAASELSEGEIKKVDKDAGKVTIRHGELKNLGMGAMTMVFRIQDPAMLERVKAGDKVRFRAEKFNGALTVVRIEPAS